MATYRQSESRCGEGYLEQGVNRPKKGKGLSVARVKAAEDISCKSVVVCYGLNWF